ncbi:poly(ADP-ribose) polymerase family member 14-related sequence 3 isoform X2 [Amia ocellicauda]|uniref:poly(ADP-ribose) polymerase family member 14-related sequence 3 isoform X2 n=1 Tax=Amia ocellicauda TaxID=2972642 RepID=UPI0034642855
MAMYLVVLEGLPDDLDRVKPRLDLYFQNKRRSGGEVLEIRHHPDDRRKAVLVYLDEAAKNKVLERKVHKVDFKTLGTISLQAKPFDEAEKGRSQVKQIHPARAQHANTETSTLLGKSATATGGKKHHDVEDKSLCPGEAEDSWRHQDDGPPRDALLLLSSDCPVNKELLQLHFEQYAEDVEINSHQTNQWILKCDNQTDLKTVLTKEKHDLNGTTITVKLYDEKAEEQKFDPRRVILSGFSGDTKWSFISLYVKSCSKGTEHVWEILEDGRIAVTFMQDLNIKSFLKKCFNKPLQNSYITVSRLERTDSVLVGGQTSKISEEVLKLYFSNLKRSKGGQIKSLTRYTEAEGVIIAFEDFHAAYRVSEQQHEVCGVKLTAHLYYASLQKALTGELCTPPGLPRKISIPVDPLLLDYIKCTKQYQEAFEETLSKVYAKVYFEGSPKPHQVSLEVTVASNSLLLYRVAPDWESNVRQMVRSFLDKYGVIQLESEIEIWEKIKTKCLEIISVDLHVSFDFSSSTIVLIGQRNKVKSLQATIQGLMTEANIELVNERNTIECNIKMDSKEEMDFLWNLIFPKLTDVLPTKDEAGLVFHLKGHRDKVSQAESLIRETQQKLVTRTPRLSAGIMQFLKTVDMKKFERDHFLQNGISATILNHDSMQILAEEKDIKEAEDKLRESVSEVIITLNADQAEVAKGEKWKQFFSELKEEVDSNSKVPSLSIGQTDTQITICGFSDVVADVARKLKGYLANKMPATEVILLKAVRELEFVDSCMKLSEDAEIKALGATILPVRIPASPCLKVTAATENIKNAVAAVKKKTDSIVSEKVTWSKAGESKVLEKHQDSFKARAAGFGCKLWFAVEQARKIATTTSYDHKIGDLLNLSIVHGDVTKHAADAMVCPLNGDLAFDNPISQQFLKIGGAQIKVRCDSRLKEQQPIVAGDVILSSPGNLACTWLIFAVTPIWGKCNSREKTYLYSAVLQCLCLAEVKQCSSIALPVLGQGNFGIPTLDSASAMLQAVQDFCSSNRKTTLHLKNIFVVESDIMIFEELQNVIKGMGKISAGKLESGAPRYIPHLPLKPLSLLLKAATVSVHGIRVTLKKGDITTEAVDVIVNSTNSSLNLDTGVSAAILKAAGKSVVDECTKLGTQPADGVVSTGGGNLQCKHIIQMVGPINVAGITLSVEKVMNECQNKQATSVALPAIGTGRGGIAHRQSIEAVLKGLENYFSKTSPTTITSIYIIAFEQKVYDAFQAYFAEINLQSGGNVQVASQSHLRTAPTNLSLSQGLPNVQAMLSPFLVKICNVTVEVKKGDITKETVRGIVNSTNHGLNLKGGVSGAIFKAAGSSVEDECKAHGKQADDGVVVTSGGELYCDFIIHMIGPKSLQAVEAQVQKVLQECEKNQITTVSFPAVGTGGGGLKATEVMAWMLQGFKNHLSQQSQSVIKFIYVIVAQDNILDAFRDGLKKWTIKTLVGSVDDRCSDSWESASEEDDSSQPPDSIEILIGRIRVKAVCGDITKENTDAIVSSTNTTLNLNSGVSAAILKAAGQSVVDECTALGTQASNGFAITSPGNLQVKHIVHMVGQTTEKAITESMCKVLTACEEKKMQSVSFPALGTGAGNLGATQVASAMINAIGRFVIDHVKPSVTFIRIVIFQKKLMLDFEDIMKRFKVVTPKSTRQAKTKSQPITPNSSLRNLTALVTHPVMTVEVYGTAKESITQVKKCIEDLVRGECTSQDVDAKYADHFLEVEKQEIAGLTQKHQVRIEVGPSKMTVTGKKDDVLTAVLEINGFMQKAKDRESRKEEQERMKNIVQWEAVKSEKPKPLSSDINYELELAYQKKEKTYVYTWHGESFTIDFEKMQQTGSKGRVMKIKRTPLINSETALIELPVEWTNMKGQNMEVIGLLSTSEEFQKISKEFIKSCQKGSCNVEVVQIERIQNREQWERYAIKRQALDRKYPKQKNEQLLYHGTTNDICQKINKTGFNRSFCGRNDVSFSATKFGQGTYFAKEAHYSCHDSYSNPDAVGHKYIYRARVLTGKLCRGVEGMKEPTPVNPNDPHSDLCDCAVDSLSKPFVHVIFSDFGAYPEYLITFKTV